MICKLMEWLISDAHDSGTDYRPIVKRHMARCDGCRAFAELSASLATRLTADAANVAVPLVVKDHAGSPHRPSLFSRPALAIAAACLLLAIGFWVVNHRPTTRGDDHDGDVELIVTTIPSPAALLRVASISNVLPEEPYSRELTALVDDSTRALNSIAACAGLDTELLATLVN